MKRLTMVLHFEQICQRVKIYNCILVNVTLVFILFACSSNVVSRATTLDELKTLDNIDQIEIYGSDQVEKGVWNQYLLKIINDVEQVTAIVEAFRGEADNWQVGRYKPHLPGRLTINFYNGEKLKASIMIVSYVDRIDATLSMSYFLSKLYGPAKPIDRAEFDKLIKLLDVDEELALYNYSNIIEAP